MSQPMIQEKNCYGFTLARSDKPDIIAANICLRDNGAFEVSLDRVTSTEQELIVVGVKAEEHPTMNLFGIEIKVGIERKYVRKNYSVNVWKDDVDEKTIEVINNVLTLIEALVTHGRPKATSIIKQEWIEDMECEEAETYCEELCGGNEECYNRCVEAHGC